MTRIHVASLIIILLTLAGCEIPFGNSSGPGDDRSPYFSNESTGSDNPQPSEQFPPGQAESLN